MSKYQTQRKRLLIAIVMLTAILVGLCGVAYAQYRQSITISDTGSLTISADIGSIEVWEHVAQRQLDGSYVLDINHLTQGNSYLLMPGVDIPKDPFVKVTKNSTIDAYVFIEVTSNLPETVTYTLGDCWERVDGYNNVYVYCQERTPVKVAGDVTIQILEDNTLYVSQYYQGTGSCGLQVTAYLYQAAAGNDAAEVYGAYQTQNQN